MFKNDGSIFYREKFKYAQDYDFYLCLLSKGKKISNIPQVLLKYRIIFNSISSSNRGKQKMFSYKANEFYHQRLKYGKDTYDEFKPNEILNINIETSKNKIIIKYEVEASFKLNDFEKTKKFCKKYFENYGYFNRLLIYYILTFTSKGFVNLLRKILFN